MKTIQFHFEESGRKRTVRIQGDDWTQLRAEMRTLIREMESKMDWTLQDIRKGKENYDKC